MNNKEQFLGIVKNGKLQLLAPKNPEEGPVRLTGTAMIEAISPEGKELDLTNQEGKALMVQGHLSGKWIWSAKIVDEAGPILTAVVREAFC